MADRTIALSMLATAGILTAGCTAKPATTAEISAPAATVVGDAVSCIQTSRISSTRVHDDRTIDFELTGSTIYRNTLPVACSGLGFEERFAYRTTIGRLCSSDTITVLQSGGVRGPTCGLGEFVPVRYADTD